MVAGGRARFREQYTALWSWADGKGVIDGTGPTIPGRLGWAAFLTVSSGLVLTLGLASRELILQTAADRGTGPACVHSPRGRRACARNLHQSASDQTGNTETTFCQTSTTRGRRMPPAGRPAPRRCPW